MTVRTNWREDAACGDADPDLFFPIGTGLPPLPCANPVPGLGAGNGVTDGVWGGTTEDERQAIHRFREERNAARNITMAKLITKQGPENVEYISSLLRQKQPGFSVTAHDQ
jgi:WhiB family transcriptional regulator, redox-sensing transcriptional regulator